MGFLTGGGLLGKLLRDKQRSDYNRAMNDYINDCQQRATAYRCRYCGKMCRYGGAFSSPSPTYGGKCPNSPYGTHDWRQ